MIKVTVITTQGCMHCIAVKKTLNTLKKDYPDLQVKEIDATSGEGQKLIKEYNILSSPGILVNDEFFAMGGATEEQFRKKFDLLKK